MVTREEKTPRTTPTIACGLAVVGDVGKRPLHFLLLLLPKKVCILEMRRQGGGRRCRRLLKEEITPVGTTRVADEVAHTVESRVRRRNQLAKSQCGTATPSTRSFYLP